MTKIAQFAEIMISQVNLSLYSSIFVLFFMGQFISYDIFSGVNLVRSVTKGLFDYHKLTNTVTVKPLKRKLEMRFFLDLSES